MTGPHPRNFGLFGDGAWTLGLFKISQETLTCSQDGEPQHLWLEICRTVRARGPSCKPASPAPPGPAPEPTQEPSSGQLGVFGTDLSSQHDDDGIRWWVASPGGAQTAPKFGLQAEAPRAQCPPASSATLQSAAQSAVRGSGAPVGTALSDPGPGPPSWPVPQSYSQPRSKDLLGLQSCWPTDTEQKDQPHPPFRT